MSVATWLRSLFTTQDPTTYKSAIDGNFAVLERVGAMFAAQQAAAPNMTVIIRAGSIMNNGALVEVAQQTTITITAPVSTSRIDRIVIDQQTGIYTIVAGVVSGSPVAPAIPAGKLPCAQLLLQSTSTTITNAMITDERVFGSTSAALYALLASPALTGIPTAPTAAALNNSTQLATTAYVDAAAVAATFPSGTRMPFNQTAAPAGWTKDTTAALNDTAMRIVTGAVGSGGSVAFSSAAYTSTLAVGAHVLTVAEMPSHTHNQAGYVGYITSVSTYAGGNAPRGSNVFPVVDTFIQASGGDGGHTHPLTGSGNITLALKYNDFIIASKN
jgi:hypothetical protein